MTVTADPEMVDTCVTGVGVHVEDDDLGVVDWDKVEGVVDDARVGVMEFDCD